MTGRGRIILAACVLAALGVGLAAALFNERRIEGAIPVRTPVLSLAVTEEGFFAGTAGGLLVSPDGVRWRRSTGSSSERTILASGEFLAAAIGDALYRVEGLEGVERIGELPFLPSALAGSDSRIYALAPHGRLTVVHPGEFDVSEDGPDGMRYLAAGDGVLYAAGAGDGVWLFDGRWTKLLDTPATSVLADLDRPGRVLIGTAGGVLVSGNGGRSWRFTGLREPTEALASHREAFYAVARGIVYRSPDGDSGWAALPLASEGD